MRVDDFIKIIGDNHFYTGVPDSLLSGFCKYLMDRHGICEKHIIGVNEGACVAMAAGNYLSTGKIPVVYMQNSGIGNAVNPIVSLMSQEVYAIPCIYIIGWRGEPGTTDEPQHVFQGEITPNLLKCMNLEILYLGKDTTINEFDKKFHDASEGLNNGGSLAVLVSKGALEYDGGYCQLNDNVVSRENVIDTILDYSEGDLVVSTTGKTSRELFELRERRGDGHDADFLTVGSMGHSSSIALGVTTGTDRKVWCLDGDGSLLMHTGSMSTIGSVAPSNFVHVLLNNESHESVGGYPTTVASTNMCGMASSFGYSTTHSVSTIEDLEAVLELIVKTAGPHFVEIKVLIGSRDDLGRPTSAPKENKLNFINNIRSGRK